MCGIAGFIGKLPIEENRVKSCLSKMEHRGPDASGIYRYKAADDRHICLLHSRLNIIDLDDRSNQPLQLDDTALSYNGELYNYIELRNELRKEGVGFHTESDTEVLLSAYKHWGESALDRFEGMWAFALYDESSDRLLLCRDRFGEKPLYYLEAEEGVYFGSEAKFIFALAGRKLKPNVNHLHRYMINGYKSLHKQRATFFENLKEVPSANVLDVSRNGIEERPFWKPEFRPDESMSYETAVEKTREALIESVRLRLRADVPMAFCMSGGIDSNSLISIAKQVFNYDVHGFTIVNTDERYEEQDIVDATVAELGLRHTSVHVTTDRFLERLRHLVVAHDAPVLTITYYAQWMLLEAIREAGYKISVSGSGADELYSGYYDHHLLYLASVFDDKKRYEEAVKEWQTHILPIVRNPFLQNPRAFVDQPQMRDHIYLNAEEFASWLTKEWQEDFKEQAYCDQLMRNRMMNELFQETVPPILHEDDHNAMYYSIENRSPFLDRELFDTAYSIPTRHLVQRGMAKVVLRDAMRGIVPDVVLNSHRKVGFNAPIFSFLDISDPTVKDEILRDSPIYEYVRREKVEALMAKDTLPNSESKFVFYFLCSKMFLEEFGE